MACVYCVFGYSLGFMVYGVDFLCLVCIVAFEVLFLRSVYYG